MGRWTGETRAGFAFFVLLLKAFTAETQRTQRKTEFRNADGAGSLVRDPRPR